jgi:hypothetical protein
MMLLNKNQYESKITNVSPQVGLAISEVVVLAWAFFQNPNL